MNEQDTAVKALLKIADGGVSVQAVTLRWQVVQPATNRQGRASDAGVQLRAGRWVFNDERLARSKGLAAHQTLKALALAFLQLPVQPFNPSLERGFALASMGTHGAVYSVAIHPDHFAHPAVVSFRALLRGVAHDRNAEQDSDDRGARAYLL